MTKRILIYERSPEGRAMLRGRLLEAARQADIGEIALREFTRAEIDSIDWDDVFCCVLGPDINAETDEIVGFNMGADDYVTKPFRVQPLIHRIKALLRRTETAEAGKNFLSLHGVEIDRATHSAKFNGIELDLTPTEFRMLWTLMSQPGRPFSRNELMETSRGEDANSLERTIDVHVRSLRKKLGDTPDLIETVRGIGYRFLRK